nr:hypothetical protein [Tanacetum cinerariifolium]
MVETPKEQFIQMDDQEKNAHVLDAHSYNFIHEEDNNEDADDHRYILGGVLGKIVDSYHLSFDDSMRVSLDVPSPTTGDQAGPSVKDDSSGLTKPDSPRARSTETSTDVSLKTAV